MRDEKDLPHSLKEHGFLCYEGAAIHVDGKGLVVIWNQLEFFFGGDGGEPPAFRVVHDGAVAGMFGLGDQFAGSDIFQPEADTSKSSRLW